jgi:gliding motility-associated-like protein
MLVNANSFEGLTDTIFIIFQCAGNTSGHFSNGANSPRSLQVNYTGTCVSAQTVSYLPTNLLGGDGGAIFFDTLGIGSYYNTGCNAPVPGLNPFWNFPAIICNDYGLINLNTLLSGNATTDGIWSGDIENVNFFNSTGKLGNYSITYTLVDTSSCLGSADSTLNFIVEDVKTGSDTVLACDSIRQFGIWIFKDTIIEVNVANPNTFRCDSLVRRLYQINQADFQISPEAVLVNSGSEVSFTITGANSSYSFWNEQGDTCFMPCLENSFSPTEEGTYTFNVVNSDNLCIKELIIEVKLIFYSSLNVPNAFTPNDDGFNDVFKLYGKDLQFLNYSIYSQWGELLFNGNALNDFWDGTFKGKPVSSGSYVLQITAAGKDGQRFDELKKISLIR